MTTNFSSISRPSSRPSQSHPRSHPQPQNTRSPSIPSVPPSISASRISEMNIAPLASTHLGLPPNTPLPTSQLSPYLRSHPHQPLYLLHGFRWARKSIRIHVIIHNLEDAAPDYIMATASSSVFLKNLQKLHPTLTEKLPSLRLVEEYDPEDLSDTGGGATQPFAFVAESVTRVGNVPGDKGGGEAESAIAKLRDELAPEEKVEWWVIWNGDPERGDEGQGAERMLGLHAEGDEEEEEDGDGDVTPGADGRPVRSLPLQQPKTDIEATSPGGKSSLESGTSRPQQKKEKSGGMMKWFKKGSKSDK